MRPRSRCSEAQVRQTGLVIVLEAAVLRHTPHRAAGSSLHRVEQTVQLCRQLGAPGAQVLGGCLRTSRPAPQAPCVGVLGLLPHTATTVASSKVYSLPVLQVRSLTWSQGLRSGEGGTGPGGSTAHNGDLASQNASLAF